MEDDLKRDIVAYDECQGIEKTNFDQNLENYNKLGLQDYLYKEKNKFQNYDIEKNKIMPQIKS